MKTDEKIMIKAVTKEEARQALKTIAQYCDEVDCFECEIEKECDRLSLVTFPFYRLGESMKKPKKK